MATSPISTSATQSGAAKDDVVGLNGDYTFSIADLLANDPGGAAKVDVTKQFLFGTTEEDWADQAGYLADHGIKDNGDGTFTIEGGATDFQYMVQIGNKGTWSTADVDVTAPPPHLSGIELVTNWDFEKDDADNDVGYVDVAAVAGWDNEAGTTQPMQVQHESFGFVTGFAEGEEQWLDTAASPGNIHIGQDIDVGTGAQAQLSVSVAAENILWSGNTYQPDADDHLLFKFNGETVLDVTLQTFTNDQGNVDWNVFRELTVLVTGKDGMDHLEIETTGMDQLVTVGDVINGAAGFAVDHVSVQEWII